jgi:hypothetical protein
MARVRKLNISESYTPSSESYSNYLVYKQCSFLNLPLTTVTILFTKHSAIPLIALGLPHTSEFCYATVSSLSLGCTHEKWLSQVTFIKTRTSYTIDIKNVAIFCALMVRNRKNKWKKDNWVHPIYSDRLLKGIFYTLHEKLRDYPKNVHLGYYVINGECYIEPLMLTLSLLILL